MFKMKVLLSFKLLKLIKLIIKLSFLAEPFINLKILSYEKFANSKITGAIQSSSPAQPLYRSQTKRGKYSKVIISDGDMPMLIGEDVQMEIPQKNTTPSTQTSYRKN